MHTPAAYNRRRHFARHYVEMVIAMMLGMAVLLPASAVGVRSSVLGEEAMLLVMATAMTLPMAAWMRHCVHGWAPIAEMSAAMLVPAFGGIALMAGGTRYHEAMAIEHVAMFGAMLVAMLWRRDE